jgi:hypothetical protein
LKRTYTGTLGYLRGYHPFADAGRVMAPRQFMIEWGNLTALAF